MHRFLAVFSVLLAFLFSASFWATKAEEKKTITWLVWELSPEFIRSGTYAGQGFADKFLAYFMEHLPQYNHAIQWTSIRRFHRDSMLSQRCTPHIWGTFHPDKFLYSQPYFLTPPHIAIFAKKYEKRFGPQGTVLSLKDLFEKEKLTLITPPTYQKQPRYPVLHDTLKPFIGTPQIQELKNSANEVDLRLLIRDRADFALSYPTTVTAQRRDRGLVGDFVTYGLMEHQIYKEIHVSCYGDEFGRRVVGQIDRLMDKKALMHFLGLYEEWNQKDKAFREAFRSQIVSLRDN